jgi:hypothetical protein
MSPEQRQDLFSALVSFYEEDAPTFLKELMDASVEEALRRQASQPRRIGFVRGDRTPAAGPKWPDAAAPHNQGLRRRSSLKKEEAAASGASNAQAKERHAPPAAGEHNIEAELTPPTPLPIGFYTPEQVRALDRVATRSLHEGYAWKPVR